MGGRKIFYKQTFNVPSPCDWILLWILKLHTDGLTALWKFISIMPDQFNLSCNCNFDIVNMALYIIMGTVTSIKAIHYGTFFITEFI